uniref:Uncharacterized protein n=1 Tax=Heterorhabditis bacteriophora TaxID=37862 RepID=A0A1I7WVV2_HETBA
MADAPKCCDPKVLTDLSMCLSCYFTICTNDLP